MSTNINTTEQRLVQRITQLENGETPEDVVKGRKFVQRRARELWIKRLTAESDLPGVIKHAAVAQVGADNRAKPVGLFLNRDDVVAIQDELMPHRSTESKRQSLIESFHFWLEESYISSRFTQTYSAEEIRTAAIDGISSILRESELPTSDISDLELYVEKVYTKFDSLEVAIV